MSDTIVLGASNSQHSQMNNDLPPGTRIGPISILGSFSISGNPLILTGDVTGDSLVRWDADLKMETDVILPGIAFNGGLDVNGHSVTLHLLRTQQFNSPPVLINSPISGTGLLTVNGTRFKITHGGTFSGTVHVQHECELDASMLNANFIVDSGELDGNGTIGNLSGAGLISPGINPFPFIGALNTKSLSLDGGYVASINYFNPTSDRISVTGTVSLSGALYPALGIAVTTPPLGREVVIIENDGTDPVIGTFQGLPEGGFISADGWTLRISYHGGDGNDVTLTNVAYGKLWTGACSHNWSDACNWSPASVPQPGEVLDFGAHQASGTPPINDFPAGFAVGGLTVNGYELMGNPITLMGDLIAGVDGAHLYMPIKIGALVHVRCPYLGTVDVNGQTLFIDGPTQIPELIGSGTIVNNGYMQVISGSFAGTLSGFLELGSLPNVSISGVSHLSGFLGNANVADIAIDAGGTIDPGPASFYPPAFVGTISATSLSLSGTYDCDLDANIGDQIIVMGSVSLSGPLNVVVRKAVQTAPFFKIIDNRGLAPVSGTFSGLPEGAVVQAGSSTFTITYRGGDGNDVVLFLEPPPVVSLSQDAADTVFGEPFTIRASVAGRGSVVTFNDGSVLLGSATPNLGVVMMDVANLGVGIHQITAAFGTATATITHNVKRGSTALTVTDSIGVGQVVTVNVAVRPLAPAAGGPIGLVSIEVDGATVGSAPLALGTATITTLPLPLGRHTIAAHYSGDPSFDPGNGSSEVVIAPARGRSVRH